MRKKEKNAMNEMEEKPNNDAHRLALNNAAAENASEIATIHCIIASASRIFFGSMEVIWLGEMLRIGPIDASWHNTFKSAPENPLVIRLISIIRSSSILVRSFFKRFFKNSCRTQRE